MAGAAGIAAVGCRSVGSRQHAALLPFVERGTMPGFVALTSRKGDVEVSTGGVFGYGAAQPMARDTLFRIASMTKPMTAAVTMMLVGEGKLKLDDPIDTWIPELAERRVLSRPDGPLNEAVPAKRPITLRHLLTMTSGIGLILSPEKTPMARAMSAVGVSPGPQLLEFPSSTDFLKSLATLPLMHHPGDVWTYDTPYAVLGALLERVSKQTLDVLMQERLFGPLGMKDTGYLVPGDKVSRLPTAYAGTEVFDEAGGESTYAKARGFSQGNHGLVSTVDDVLAFARMMLGQGGPTLLPEATRREMMTDQLSKEVKAASPFTPGFWSRHGWGFGGSPVHSPQPGDPHGFGWDGGYGTTSYWDASTGTIGILLTQRMMDSPTGPEQFREYWKAVYPAG